MPWAGLIAILACDVESTTPRHDTGIGGPRDASAADGGATRCSGECGEGFYCEVDTPSGAICVAKPTSCATTRDCRGEDICTHILTSASTTSSGLGSCKSAAYPRCATSNDCARGSATISGEICTAIGFCSRELSNTATTASSQTCGDFGDDDEPEDAIAIDEGLVFGPAICPASDVDWYRFRVPACGASDACTGVRVVVTATASLPSMRARLWGAIDDVPFAETSTTIRDGLLEFYDDANRVAGAAWDRLTVFEIATSTIARTFLLEVYGERGIGAYAIALERHAGLCLGDALEYYGDNDCARAVDIPFNGSELSLRRRQCVGDIDTIRVPVADGERLEVSTSAGTATVVEPGIDGRACVIVTASTAVVGGSAYTLRVGVIRD